MLTAVNMKWPDACLPELGSQRDRSRDAWALLSATQIEITAFALPGLNICPIFAPVIDTDQKLAELLPNLQAADWIALDTEADSLHAYPEKLCLLQISIPKEDLLIDPLASLDL